MRWFKESSIIQSFIMKIIKRGELPHHIAFIMDGNRRYAKKLNLVRADGHLHGFERLSQILGWCRDLAIKEITVYAFARENFQRSPEEVEDLMSIAREKFQHLIEELDEINENGVCVRFWGELSMLPEDMQRLVSRIMLSTKENNRAYLNVCFAYGSRYEIAGATNKLLVGVENKLIDSRDIDEKLMERCLYSSNSSPPDLLIRTSGEVRLSDFLLWQSGFSLLCFVKTLWPEFSFWDLMYCIIFYQKHRLNNVDNELEEEIEDLNSTSNLEDSFLKSRTDRINRIDSFIREMDSRSSESLRNSL
ncbi:dehydrodolichyl diphosphate synthase subunit [Brevipalpus obovatus]|uniref:dehydrodolichyl diphosphate synthase subunit n=1 Tax=Brevipalpus obovatus TaxID=246614 RepID=UPI003D9ED580